MSLRRILGALLGLHLDLRDRFRSRRPCGREDATIGGGGIHLRCVYGASSVRSSVHGRIFDLRPCSIASDPRGPKAAGFQVRAWALRLAASDRVSLRDGASWPSLSELRCVGLRPFRGRRWQVRWQEATPNHPHCTSFHVPGSPAPVAVGLAVIAREVVH